MDTHLVKSGLTLHRHLALKRPFQPKTDQNFAVMKMAEQKRRRKQIRNLEVALSEHTPITVAKAKSILWTPEH